MANGFCARNHWLRHQVQPEAAATILVTAVFVAKEGAEVEASALPLASTAAHSPPRPPAAFFFTWFASSALPKR